MVPVSRRVSEEPPVNLDQREVNDGGGFEQRGVVTDEECYVLCSPILKEPLTYFVVLENWEREGRGSVFRDRHRTSSSLR